MIQIIEYWNKASIGVISAGYTGSSIQASCDQGRPQDFPLSWVWEGFSDFMQSCRLCLSVKDASRLRCNQSCLERRSRTWVGWRSPTIVSWTLLPGFARRSSIQKKARVSIEKSLENLRWEIAGRKFHRKRVFSSFSIVWLMVYLHWSMDASFRQIPKLGSRSIRDVKRVEFCNTLRHQARQHLPSEWGFTLFYTDFQGHSSRSYSSRAWLTGKLVRWLWSSGLWLSRRSIHGRGERRLQAKRYRRLLPPASYTSNILWGRPIFV